MPSQHFSPFYELKPGDSFGPGAIYVGGYGGSHNIYCVVDRLIGGFYLTEYGWAGSFLSSGDALTSVDFWELQGLLPELCSNIRYAIKVLEGEHINY